MKKIIILLIMLILFIPNIVYATNETISQEDIIE